MSDRIVGVLLFILAVGYGLQAGAFETMILTDPLGPAVFPQLLAILLGLASIYLIVRPDPGAQWPRGLALLHFCLTVIVLVIYAFVLEPVGFVVATFVALAVLAVQLGTRLVPAVVMGLLASFGLYATFDLFLGLPLPAGSLLFGG